MMRSVKYIGWYKPHIQRTRGQWEVAYCGPDNRLWVAAKGWVARVLS